MLDLDIVGLQPISLSFQVNEFILQNHFEGKLPTDLYPKMLLLILALLTLFSISIYHILTASLPVLFQSNLSCSGFFNYDPVTPKSDKTILKASMDQDQQCLYAKNFGVGQIHSSLLRNISFLTVSIHGVLLQLIFPGPISLFKYAPTAPKVYSLVSLSHVKTIKKECPPSSPQQKLPIAVYSSDLSFHFCWSFISTFLV